MEADGHCRGCGSLYVVATPIGNLGDITIRAIDTLKTVDVIACEDTRRTKILTSRYGINTPLISFFAHNEVRKTAFLIEKLKEGKSVALVSDAGTPGISDPGYVIIRASIDNAIPVVCIPGPSALISALVISGKPTNKFVFEGFLSNKSGKRRRRLEELKTEERTVILYESPHRIINLLADIADIMGNRQIICVRELTKKFEEILRGEAASLADTFRQNPPKGEFTVII
ncbi:MAG: 16S rRNA (cytidine(1402)-2'-O)-methyltransferase [Candidatus Omnitrophota bacterium]